MCDVISVIRVISHGNIEYKLPSPPVSPRHSAHWAKQIISNLCSICAQEKSDSFMMLCVISWVGLKIFWSS